MNFSYEFSKMESDSLMIKINPNELIKGDYTLLENCLSEDIGDFEQVLNYIDDVLIEKVESKHCGGNFAIANFNHNNTEIYFCNDPDNPARCTLPTWLFREIVEVWLKEAKKDFEEKHPNN